MIISLVRKSFGALIVGFGLTALMFTGWSFLPASEMSRTPDLARGLIYPCYPKSIPWYFSDYTVVRSWNFIVYAAILLLGTVVNWGGGPLGGTRSKPQWLYSSWETVALILGAALAVYVVAISGERQVIPWLMAHGVRPPALPCFPLYSGK